jgi:hypothetical protein
MNVAQETLGFRRGRFSRPLSLLMSAFALPIPPASFTRHLHRLTERSPTISYEIRSFGSWLEPRYIFRAGRLD